MIIKTQEGNNQYNINYLIKEAIDASFDFDKIMDGIDFNSYLPKDKYDNTIEGSKQYKNYVNKINEALGICNKIISKREIKDNNCILKSKDKKIGFLIYNLFKVKIIRIIARRQIERKKEEKYYINITHRLHKAFEHTPKESWFNSWKDKNLLDDYNWAKILYYNEFSICYSGLAKSSMSLGYAGESIFILENLYGELKTIENPAKDTAKSRNENFKKKFKGKNNLFTPSQIIKLYTFALYNKAEAERLLHNTDSALKTFQRIIEIYGKSKKMGFDASLTDYSLALLKKALILNDQGRGEEAIGCLDSEEIKKLSCTDYRAHDRDLEHASALIDQKEYEKAMEFLQNFDSEDFKNTFIQRQAKVQKLRLINEFKKNKPEDYKLDKASPEIIKIKKDFEKMAKELICEASIRKDGDSFKTASTKLAEYYQHKNIEKEKYSQEALKYLYLYLFENKIFSNENNGSNNILQSWLYDNTDIDSLLKKYKKKIKFCPDKELEYNEDDNYLKNFFDTYINLFIKKENFLKIPKNQVRTITKLKDRLNDIYYQEGKDNELEQVNIKFEHLTKKVKLARVIPIKDFIEKYYFQKKTSGMNADTIVYQMKQNTTEFIGKIIDTSIFPKENKTNMQGTLSVLRRWNSFTPTLSSSINQSKGGGYFLRFSYNDKSFGIVIDPGYDFLKNFFSQGFIIQDIDLVLVSHVHPDHVDNLAAILSLFHEMNGRLGKYHYKMDKNKKNLTLILSPGVFEHYNHIISYSFEILKDIIVVDGKDDPKQPPYTYEFNKKNKIEIKAFETAHEDLSRFQSLGFIITIKNDDRKTVIGYTGDIKWQLSNTPNLPKYLKCLKECNIVCVHLGSLINILNGRDFCSTFCCKSPKDYKNNKCERYDECRESVFKKVKVTKEKLIEQVRDENHLYLAGLTMFLYELLKGNKNLKLSIISEFGEELMHGIRIDLYEKFDSWFKKIHKGNPKPICLIGDIGLEVDVFTGAVYCHCCKRFVDRCNIEPIPYGKDEAICFVCKECKSVLSTYQIDHILKDYHENGRNRYL